MTPEQIQVKIDELDQKYKKDRSKLEKDKILAESGVAVGDTYTQGEGEEMKTFEVTGVNGQEVLGTMTFNNLRLSVSEIKDWSKSA